MNLRQQKRRLARTFAHAVFLGRERQKLTQEETAARVFISLRWYQKIEAGQVLPSFFVGICLMHLLDITPETLVGEVIADVSVPTHS